MPELPTTQGRLVTAISPATAVGLPNDYTLPARVRWKLINVFFTLAAAGVAVNRFAEVNIIIAGASFLRIIHDGAQIVGWTMFYNFGAGLGRGADVNAIGAYVNLPVGLLIPELSVIRVTAVNMQAADQISDVQLIAEEWIEPLA